MSENKKILTVAMSGGVDSAVAALLAMREGYSVRGATMLLCDHDTGESDGANDAAAVCRALGIDHRIYDMRKEFHDTVIDDFVRSYLAGKTPNPCIVCNKYLKFGALLDAAIKDGADLIATGHYARITRNENGRFLLYKAADPMKDQSYMLWSLSQDQLSHTLLPLGELTKPEIRRLAEEAELCIARKSDSQDICFVPDGDYASFIESELGTPYPEGDYVDENGNVLGRHKGMIHYTIGQRKGLGISMGRHVFVADKDPLSNRVLLTDEDRLFSRKVVINNVNLIPYDRLEGAVRVKAKIRYRHTESDALAEQTGDGEITLTFDEPQRAPAKGQSAVLYDGDLVIGGGIIK